MNASNAATRRISLGRTQVSRLIVGHNPPCGNSHVSAAMNQQMAEYFTEENVLCLYERAEQLGMGTILIRGDYRMLHWLEMYRRRGGKMNVIAQTASEMHDVFVNIRILAAAGITAVYHHGTQTDRFWWEGRIDQTLDYLQCMRDCGVDVGLATHLPEVIDYAEEHDWPVDFYMCCFYNLSRKPRESAIVSGKADYVQEEYLAEDRDAMCRRIAAVTKPVLAFKVLAASRHCTTQEDVRQAFGFAYSHIKPDDAIVVGLFPKDIDQVALDLQYAHEAIVASADSHRLAAPCSDRADRVD